MNEGRKEVNKESKGRRKDPRRYRKKGMEGGKGGKVGKEGNTCTLRGKCPMRISWYRPGYNFLRAKSPVAPKTTTDRALEVKSLEGVATWVLLEDAPPVRSIILASAVASCVDRGKRKE